MPAKSVRGHTLPELLIGLSVGLLVTAMGWTALGTAQHTWQLAKAGADLQRQGLAALDNIARHVQLAGSTARPALHVSEGPQGARLTIVHDRALDPIDCQGNRGGKEDWLQLDYRLTPKHELQCKDLRLAASTYQAVADGVEDFRVRLAQAPSGAASLQWRTPSEVQAGTHVVALEVCLRMASAQRFHAHSANHPGCRGETVADDGRLRYVLRRLVWLRAGGVYAGV